MHTLQQDLRYALRLALRRPALTLVTILTLGIGVGGNTALFSVMNALLLRPLPVPEPDRLVRVYGATSDRPFDVLSYPNASDLGARAKTLSSLAIHQQTFVAAGVGDSTDTAATELVSGNYFATMGVGVAAGRALDPRDDRLEGAERVAVISDGWWRTRYGASPTAVGSVMYLNGAGFQIVGIAPASFRGSYDAFGTDVWVPLMAHGIVRPRGLEITRRGWGWLQATGRLAPGASVEQADAELDTIAMALAREYAGPNRGLRANVVLALALPEEMAPGLRSALFFALIVVGLALCAACANIANAQLATVIARQREIAVRLAMGATRGRVLRQWLTESVLIAAAATTVGITIALWMRDALMLLRPPQPDLQNIGPNLSLDWRVLSFALAIGAFVTLLFGLLPALRAASSDVTAPLKDEAASTTAGRRRTWMQNTLVIGQVAASLMLLICAGLLVRSLNAAGTFDVGFDTRGLLLATAETGGLGWEAPRTRAYYRETVQRIRALPGVRDVTYAAVVPLSDSRESRGVLIDGHRASDGSEFISTASNVVATNYFDVMGVPLVSGRSFTAADGDDMAAPVAIINETMARRYWPGSSAVGRQIRLGRTTPPLEIVGVARDLTYYSIGEAPQPYLYLPFGREVMGSLIFHVRTQETTDSGLARLLHRELRAADPRIRVPIAMSYEEARRMPLYPSRAMAALSSTFGALALILTIVGLYGVVMYAVSQRTREFALRIALGAAPTRIVRGVVRQGMVLAIVGVIVGAIGAVLLAQLLRGLLIGISPLDPLTFITWPIVLIVVALVAAYLPARRTTKIDPAAALSGRV